MDPEEPIPDADVSHPPMDPEVDSGKSEDFGHANGAEGTTPGDPGGEVAECYELCDNQAFKIISDSDGKTVLVTFKGSPSQEAAYARESQLDEYGLLDGWKKVEEEALPDGYAICYIREGDISEPSPGVEVENPTGRGMADTTGMTPEGALEGDPTETDKTSEFNDLTWQVPDAYMSAPYESIDEVVCIKKGDTVYHRRHGKGEVVRCSEDGCRVKTADGKLVNVTFDDTDNCGGWTKRNHVKEDLMLQDLLEKKLSYKDRKKLGKSSFAEPGKRKYPIPDKSHARNALSRVSANGTAAEKAAVRRKVHKKFPSIGEDGLSLTATELVDRLLEG